VGRHRARQVAGRGAGKRVEAVGKREVGSDGDVAILEGPGRIERVVLDEEPIQPQPFPKIFRVDERREAGAQVDRLAGRRGQQLAIAPDGRRSAGDRFAADASANGVEIVSDFERSEAVLADVGGLEVP
jgi:hypothetical protein